MSAEIHRLPPPGSPEAAAALRELEAGAIGIEVYWSGTFAGIVKVRDGIVHGYCAGFGPLGQFPSIDAAAGAVAASLAH